VAEEWERLQAAADRSELTLRKEFLDMIAAIATAELERRILSALQKGQLQRVLQIIQQVFGPQLLEYQATLTNELLTIEQKSYAIAADTLGLGKMVGSFDLTNPEAVDFARSRGSQFAQQLDLDTQQLLKSIVSSSFTQGIPPREAAAMIRSSIGLTANQAAAMRNYREFLEGLAGRESLGALPLSVKQRVARSDVRMLPKRGVGMTEARIDKMVAKYRDRLLKERALALVRTETMSASNNGQLVLWNKAVDRGLLKDAVVRKAWIVTKDDRLCPRCKPLQGQLRRLDETFVSPYDGTTVKTPPLHWQCRCAMGLKRVRQVNR
jgi:hypothetical protein